MKPLMILGVRQVGKTYIIDEFCRKEFKNYIHVNLLERLNVYIEKFRPEYAIRISTRNFGYDKVKKLNLFLCMPFFVLKTSKKV